MLNFTKDLNDPNKPTLFDRRVMAKSKSFKSKVKFSEKNLRKFSEIVNQSEHNLPDLETLKKELYHCPNPPDIKLAQLFAHIRQRAEKVLGLRHYDVQVMGAYSLMYGVLAEMETSEGKTLTATLPAAAMALCGIPVHVITVNPYLSERDFNYAKALFQDLGLTVGLATETMDMAMRAKGYQCDICYCTNKQLIFDYLHDRISNQTPLVPNLAYALVDEADGVFIDDAITPMIISRTIENNTKISFYQEALKFARMLKPMAHYELDKKHKKIELTEDGEFWVRANVCTRGNLWKSPPRALFTIIKALSALYCFDRDHDYLVRDDKVHIVDKNTGRISKGRSWEQGLHQLIETKENLPLTQGKEILAKMTIQRFFQRYWRLSGMTGTAQEVANELVKTYQAPVVVIPTHHVKNRKNQGLFVFKHLEAKIHDIIKQIKTIHHTGQPILVGTTSVAESEALSKHLSKAKLTHDVLNARQDALEAYIISKAGDLGKITIATNMAGRGTDIKITPEAKQAGGLYVLVTSPNESARVDRQLIGRAARQADPGAFSCHHSLDDPLFKDTLPQWLLNLIKTLTPTPTLPIPLANWLIKKAQAKKNRHYQKLRQRMLDAEEKLSDYLGFTGEME